MKVKIGLVQASVSESKDANLSVAIEKVRVAAEQGAQVICLQELFATTYFARTQDTDNFDLAEPIPGPTTDALSSLAKELEVVLIVPLFERRGSGVFHNTAVVIDADGSLLGRYRKMHIPQDPGFEEKFYFTPGDSGYRIFETRYGKIGVLVCWDQWFPEAARLTALKGADILFYPTAIGWLPDEKASLGAAQHHAWRAVQCGHAVANACYVAAVNRVGKEGEIEFWGQSFVADYFGQVMAEAASDDEAVLFAECDIEALEKHRRIWPFFRDRRVDSYGGLLQLGEES